MANRRRFEPFIPEGSSRWLALGALGLTLAGAALGLSAGRMQSSPAMYWQSIQFWLGYIGAPVGLVTMVLAAVRERRPTTRFALGLGAVALGMVSLAVVWFAERQGAVGGGVLCMAPMVLMTAAIPLTALGGARESLATEKRRERSLDLLALIHDSDGVLRVRQAAQALNLTDHEVTVRLAELEEDGLLAGVPYPQQGLYLSAPAEERLVTQLAERLAGAGEVSLTELTSALDLSRSVIIDLLRQAHALHLWRGWVDEEQGRLIPLGDDQHVCPCCSESLSIAHDRTAVCHRCGCELLA